MIEKYNSSNTEELLRKHGKILRTYDDMFELPPKKMTELFEVLFYYLYDFRCDIFSEPGKYVVCEVNVNGKRRVDLFQYSDKPLNIRAVEAYKTNPKVNYNYRSKDQYSWFTNIGWSENAETKAEHQHIDTITSSLMWMIFNLSFTKYDAMVKKCNALQRQRPTKQQLQAALKDAARWKKEKEAREKRPTKKQIQALRDVARWKKEKESRKTDDDDMPWELKMDIFDDLMGD